MNALATIRDVAKEAGVSVATVSRHLNNKGYVSNDAKQIIEKAITTLNYAPNQLARSLTTKQTNLLGLLVPDITNPFFPELARAVERTAYEHGYTVVLCNAGETSEKEKHYIRSLQQNYAAGFIVTTNHIEADFYKKLDVPIVALDRNLSEAIPTVTSDNVLGGQLVANYLVEQNVKRILCVRGPLDIDVANDRMRGFEEIMKQHPTIQYDTIVSPFDFESAKKVTLQQLQHTRDYDAVFASSDASAIGVMKAAESLGIHIPKDVSLVGYDGINIGTLLSPELTTIAQPISLMGERATELLIALIEGQKMTAKRVVFPPKLVVRNSTTKGTEL
ncbi:MULTISPECIES: LacI family DNA-binding transcriptional regulator [Kurthia]|uniref:LacI family DNA-binding transcriptional regulator n=1 Tax=Kurthia populi TaxID=1562132 RepID=A0ABW5Y1Q7_9BACL|nr:MULTISPECIES: LacI family DNA-binding transcriptional regulator [unclassified Kurthia]